MLKNYYENYKKGRLSFITLIALFLISIVTALLIATYIPVLFDNQIEISLQALVVIIGGIPTVYLWIINQRKKEYETNLESERELNTRYVEAMKQHLWLEPTPYRH